MRALLLLLATSALTRADATLGTVISDTPLRGSPRADGIEAGMIPKGTPVIVHHEEGDWLAIQAPRGCVSWISHLFLEFPDQAGGFPKNAVVRSDGEVRLALGKAGLPKPLDVRRTAIPDGTIVLVIGPAVKSDGDRSTWYPIVPPEDDFRYLPKAAVQMSTAGGPSFVVKSPVTTSTSTSPPPPVAAIAAPIQGTSHPTWLAAQQAEAAGDLDRAEKLYFDLARAMNTPGGDGELANQCYTRIHAIRERRRNRNSQANPPESKFVASTGSTAAATEFAPSKEDVTPRITTVENRASPGQWTGSGYLRLAGFKIANQQAYALEDPRGRLLYYAVANGVDLEKYRNKTVDLFGPVTTPADLRGVPLVEATRIDQVR